MVLRVDAAAGTALVSHRAIPGRMPAMAMPLHIDTVSLAPGTRIEFELDAKRGAARRVRLVDSRDAGEFRFPDVPEQLLAGAVVPDFTLTNQRGQPVTLSSLRGRVVLVNFLYTRCPLPEVCPRLAASFASLQRRLGDRIALLSVTLDPQHDTPEVLAPYAASLRAGPAWHFLTGDTTPVARRFGLVHWPEEGVILHNSQTAIVDRAGRLAAMVEGSTYRLEQLADLVTNILEQQQ